MPTTGTTTPFDDMDGYLPPYVPPTPTGDELLDAMLELQAYRTWLEKIRYMRSDAVGMLEYTLSKQLSDSINKQILGDLLKMSNTPTKRKS